MTMPCFRLLLLAGLLFGMACPPARAETSSAAETMATARAAGDAGPVLIAESWSIGRLFSGSGGRTRVVQFCVLTMCAALFIMMRKLN